MKKEEMEKVKYPYMNSELNPKERAKDLLSRMSLEEKMGQIQCGNQISLFSSGKSKLSEVFSHGVGQVSCLIATMMDDKSQVAGMIHAQQEDIMGASEHHIPAIFHIETLCGTLICEATNFPSGIGQASTWDTEMQKKMATIISKQTRAVGFAEALAPVLDISRDPRFGRQGETYGEDPTLAAAMGVAYVEGMQQNQNRAEGVCATTKHFLAFQTGQGGMHSAKSVVSNRELREVYAKPFQAAITEGKLSGVMNSYASIDGEPVVGSKTILTDLLRKEMKFDGLTVSDYSSVGQLHTRHKVCENLTSAGLQALAAGMDMELPDPECYTKEMEEIFSQGKADIKILDCAVLRVLTTKFEYGLFENPYPADAEVLQKVFGSEENRETSLTMARESMILLKNNGVLPLKPKGKRIAVIGHHANSVRMMFGGYTYLAMKENSLGIKMSMAGVEMSDDALIDQNGKQKGKELYPGSIVTKEPTKVDELTRSCYPGIKSILEELKEACPGTEIQYAYGYPYVGNDDSYHEEALKLAKDADLVILTLGGRYGWNVASTTGEGIDTMDINLPECQEEFIKKLAQLKKPAIGIHFDGRPISSDAADASIDAIVEAWSPGQYGAEAIVDVLLGKYNPGGRLPVSVAYKAGQIPVFYAHENGSSYDMSGSIAFNSYVDGAYEPRYYFGHGLSYTSFAYSNLRIEKEALSPEEMLIVSVDVENTGDLAGDEVVQMYVKDLYASQVRPVMELAGFKRISLAPKEKKTITFKAKVSQFAFLDVDMKWKVEAGTMEALIGASAKDIRVSQQFVIEKDAFIEGADRGFYAQSKVQ